MIGRLRCPLSPSLTWGLLSSRVIRITELFFFYRWVSINSYHAELILRTIKCIYIFYHFSKLIWHRLFKSFPVEDIHFSSMVNAMSATLETKGAKASTTIFLTMLCRNIPISAPEGWQVKPNLIVRDPLTGHWYAMFECNQSILRVTV